MSPNRERPGRLPRPRRVAAAALSLLLASLALARDESSGHRLRIALEPPACTRPAGLPITPNDPGALVTGHGTHCHGGKTPELELRLPEAGYVWLERKTPNPRAWTRVGPGQDPVAMNPPPLGLKLASSDGAPTLEVRQGRTATLTPLESGDWQEVTAPDGERFWVRLVSASSLVERGRVRR